MSTGNESLCRQCFYDKKRSKWNRRQRSLRWLGCCILIILSSFSARRCWRSVRDRQATSPNFGTGCDGKGDRTIHTRTSTHARKKGNRRTFFLAILSTTGLKTIIDGNVFSTINHSFRIRKERDLMRRVRRCTPFFNQFDLSEPYISAKKKKCATKQRQTTTKRKRNKNETKYCRPPYIITSKPKKNANKKELKKITFVDWWNFWHLNLAPLYVALYYHFQTFMSFLFSYEKILLAWIHWTNQMGGIIFFPFCFCLQNQINENQSSHRWPI